MPESLAVRLEGGLGPGRAVRGEASWSVEARPASVELVLLWFARGPLGEEPHIVSRRPLPPREAGQEAFEFPVPATPVSYLGAQTCLLWAVELVVNPRRRFARAEFQVGEAQL